MSVPLSTIWKLHEMTVERFFAHDPHALRVAIRTDDATRRGAGAPRIRIDIDVPSMKPACYAFALDAVDPHAAGEPALDAPEPHRRWSAFALSGRGVAAFERARREIRGKGLKDADFSLSVTMDDVLTPPMRATSMPLRIDVALDPAVGYFTLVKEMDVEFARDATPAATTPPKAVAGATPDAGPKAPCVPAA